jgi:hypothetical protein
MQADPLSGAAGVGGTAGVGTTPDMAAGTGMTADAGTPDTTPAGPKNGDPSKPIVTLDSIPCGGSRSGTQEIGGREVTVDYPCDKHEGAHVTVILNLHGTLIGGAPYLYQHAYFSAHRFVDSHNLIVLTPRSVSKASLGAQWGNTDNGEDVPHLLAVIEWAYSAFAKFQIRALWVGGHSWGARFISGTEHPVGEPFACHPMLEHKMKGVIGMSHLRTPIACANRLSLISTRGQEEELALPDHTVVAMEHGCMTPMKGPEKIGNNDYRYFEGCDQGWVYEDYEMLGKGHTDNMDQEVVKKILDAIKSTEGP